MSKRDRHDSDRRGDRRDTQLDEEQQRRSGEAELQESDSLTALKAILSKVASLLIPMQLTQDEAIRLVEQLYANVLETDVRLAGEADDTRKSSVSAHIQNTSITRDGGKIVIEYPSARETAPAPAPEASPAAPAAPAETPAAPAQERPAAAPSKPRTGTGPRSAAPRASARPVEAASQASVAGAPSGDPPAEVPPTES